MLWPTTKLFMEAQLSNLIGMNPVWSSPNRFSQSYQSNQANQSNPTPYDTMKQPVQSNQPNPLHPILPTQTKTNQSNPMRPYPNSPIQYKQINKWYALLGLGWVGLDWLDWIGIYWLHRLDWIRLEWIGLGGFGWLDRLDRIGPDRFDLSGVDWEWVECPSKRDSMKGPVTDIIENHLSCVIREKEVTLKHNIMEYTRVS